MYLSLRRRRGPWTFNSLFEMLDQLAINVQHVAKAAFNSLFEMPPESPGDSYGSTSNSFNSLFEMRRRTSSTATAAVVVFQFSI